MQRSVVQRYGGIRMAQSHGAVPPGECAGRELCWTVHKDWFRVALTPKLAIAGLHSRRT